MKCCKGNRKEREVGNFDSSILILNPRILSFAKLTHYLRFTKQARNTPIILPREISPIHALHKS